MSVTYKTNKKSVATVTKKGVVKAVKNGKATITASVKNGSKTTKLKCVVTVLKVSDPELNRAVKLGLVTADYLKKPTADATYNDLAKLLGNVIKKRRPEKLSEWNRMTAPSAKTFQIQQTVVPLYRAARLIETDGIPKANMTQNDWYAEHYVGDDLWQKEEGNLNYEVFLPDFTWEAGSYPYIDPMAEFSGGENPIVQEMESVAAEAYVRSLGSNYSLNDVIPVDMATHMRPFKKEATHEDLALITVRFYDSFEEEPDWGTIEDLANGCAIKSSALKKAKKMRAISADALPKDWQGGALWNLGGTLDSGPNRMWHFYPADVRLMAEQGLNVVSVPFAFSMFNSPDFHGDKLRVNQNVIKELDALIEQCIENNMVVLFEGRGTLGRGKIPYDGSPEGRLIDNIMADPYFMSEEEWELWERIWTALARRYEAVSPNALLFGISNEHAPNSADQYEKMTGYYQKTIDAIRGVDPDRILYMQADSSSYEYEWNEFHKEFVEFFAKQGICIGTHPYRPSDFVRQYVGWGLSWPYTDEQGTVWDADMVYEKAIQPVREIADEFGVGFLITEWGLYQGKEEEGDGWSEDLVLTYYKDMAAMLRKHGISVIVWDWGGHAAGSLTSFEDFFEMRDGATVKSVTYEFEDSRYTLYYDPEMMKALYRTSTK